MRCRIATRLRPNPPCFAPSSVALSKTYALGHSNEEGGGRLESEIQKTPLSSTRSKMAARTQHVSIPNVARYKVHVLRHPPGATGRALVEGAGSTDPAKWGWQC